MSFPGCQGHVSHAATVSLHTVSIGNMLNSFQLEQGFQQPGIMSELLKLGIMLEFKNTPGILY